MKARTPSEAKRFEHIPNIGPAMAKDFAVLGLKTPMDLKGKDAYELYVALCEKTKAYHDPCVLDTFLAAVGFMNGKGAKAWWDFTAERKKNFHKVLPRIEKLK